MPQAERESESLKLITKEKPSWVIRNGIMLFFGVAVLFVTILNFIKFNEKIQIKLSVEDGYEIYNLSEKDSLVKRFSDGEYIKKGDSLFQTESNNNLNSFVVSNSGYFYFIKKDNGRRIIIVYPTNKIAICSFVSPDFANRIKKGMHVDISTATLNNSGHSEILSGEISEIESESVRQNKKIVKLKILPDNVLRNANLLNLISTDRATCTFVLKDKSLFNIFFERLKEKSINYKTLIE